MKEHYDSQRKLNVYKYKEGASLSLLSGANGRTEVNDFLEGKSLCASVRRPVLQSVNIFFFHVIIRR